MKVLADRVSLVLAAMAETPFAQHIPVDRDADRSAVAHGPLSKNIDLATRGLSADAIERVKEEFIGLGPLKELCADESITEIIVDGCSAIWYERAGSLHLAADRFLHPTTFANFLLRLTREIGAHPGIDVPFADGRWGDFRVHLTVAPMAQNQAHLVLRRLRVSPWTFQDLHEQQWAAERALKQMCNLIERKRNLLIIGGTGSGKTTVLAACLHSLGANERAVVIEDTMELPLPNSACARLLTRRDPRGVLREIDQTELVRQSLRMRPDRIVMGEIRGAEAKDLLLAFATGHRGCWGTLHAENARQALLRLEMLVQMGAPQWNAGTVRALISASLQEIVTVRRGVEGRRELESIHQIISLEETGFCLERLV